MPPHHFSSEVGIYKRKILRKKERKHVSTKKKVRKQDLDQEKKKENNISTKKKKTSFEIFFFFYKFPPQISLVAPTVTFTVSRSTFATGNVFETPSTGRQFRQSSHSLTLIRSAAFQSVAFSLTPCLSITPCHAKILIKTSTSL